MFNKRSLRVSFVKDPQNDTEFSMPTIDPEKIEEITRRSAVDLAKLGVASVGALMILHTTLNIVEDKFTDNKND